MRYLGGGVGHQQGPAPNVEIAKGMEDQAAQEAESDDENGDAMEDVIPAGTGSRIEAIQAAGPSSAQEDHEEDDASDGEMAPDVEEEALEYGYVPEEVEDEDDEAEVEDDGSDEDGQPADDIAAAGFAQY